jgi:hypothetical protein
METAGYMLEQPRMPGYRLASLVDQLREDQGSRRNVNCSTALISPAPGAKRRGDNPSDAADQQGRPSTNDGTLNDYTPAPLLQEVMI